MGGFVLLRICLGSLLCRAVRRCVCHFPAVAQIYLYDNNNYPVYDRLFAGSDRVTVIRAGTVNETLGLPIQQFVFKHFFETYKPLHRWAMHIDVDEFINLRQFRSIHELAMTYLNGSASVTDPSSGDGRVVGALGLAWLIFGSNKQVYYRPEPVVTRFTHRAAVEDDSAWLFKFVKSAFICAVTCGMGDPHEVRFCSPDDVGTVYAAVLPSWEIIPFRNNPIWLSKRGVDVAALNHYRMKSLEESTLRREFKTDSWFADAERDSRLDATQTYAIRDVRLCVSRYCHGCATSCVGGADVAACLSLLVCGGHAVRGCLS